MANSAWSGLAVSGGSNSGGNTLGGKTVIEVRDSGSLTIQQDLHLTLGNGEEAESTLKTVGPDASVAINGNLYMALDQDGQENFGLATLHAVISDSTHSTITVAGDAEIANGLLTVELDGYSPRGGEEFTLLEAGSVNGDEFLATDFTMGTLPDGLDWDLSINGTSVVLSISGMLECFSMSGGDLDGSGMVDFADFLILSGNFGNMVNGHELGDIDCSGTVDFADFLTLSGNFGTNPAAASAVPEPSGHFARQPCTLRCAGVKKTAVRVDLPRLFHN